MWRSVWAGLCEAACAWRSSCSVYWRVVWLKRANSTCGVLGSPYVTVHECVAASRDAHGLTSNTTLYHTPHHAAFQTRPSAPSTHGKAHSIAARTVGGRDAKWKDARRGQRLPLSTARRTAGAGGAASRVTHARVLPRLLCVRERRMCCSMCCMCAQSVRCCCRHEAPHECIGVRMYPRTHTWAWFLRCRWL